MLDVLGLDQIEAAAYRRLVELPYGTVEELAETLGAETTEAGRVVRSLEAKGLVARSSSGQDRFVASPPAIALGALVVERQEELRLAQLELNALTEMYR